MDLEAPALDARLGREPGEVLERGDELRPAIGIPGIIHRIHADEDIPRADDLRPAEREREHHGVARGHVGDRNARARRLGNRERRIGERRSADAGEIHPHDAMLARAERRRDARRRERARRHAAGRSRTLSAKPRTRRARAIASTVAESRPPESSTTAGFMHDGRSLSRHVAPQHLVELQLEAHRQPVLEDPVGERRRARLARSSARTAPGSARQRVLAQVRLAPVVILARADHELHLIARA